MGRTGLAVGCAVGIPVGFSFLVAIVLWCRMHHKYKKEDKRDEELENIIRDESGFISFDHLDTLRESQEKKAFYANEDSVASANHGSSSSEAFRPQEDGTNNIDSARRSKGSQESRPSRYYIPAYRRNLDAYRVRQMPVGTVTADGSNLSLDSTQKIRKRPTQQQEESTYDQMVPVFGEVDSKLFADQDGDAATLRNQQSQQNLQNNEKIMKNLRKPDLGSYYPKRTYSSSSLTQTNTEASASSFHTRSSSLNSVAKHALSDENVFDTPKSATAGSLGESSTGKQEKLEGIYSSRTNYDMKSAGGIQEEDQYENEFTNYSESKREFIDSLRPKRPGP